jgi:hypothetical protein
MADENEKLVKHLFLCFLFGIERNSRLPLILFFDRFNLFPKD